MSPASGDRSPVCLDLISGARNSASHMPIVHAPPVPNPHAKKRSPADSRSCSRDVLPERPGAGDGTLGTLGGDPPHVEPPESRSRKTSLAVVACLHLWGVRGGIGGPGAPSSDVILALMQSIHRIQDGRQLGTIAAKCHVNRQIRM